MKNRTKNILSFMLAFIMVLSVSINVFAAEEQPVDSRFLPQVKDKLNDQFKSLFDTIHNNENLKKYLNERPQTEY